MSIEVKLTATQLTKRMDFAFIYRQETKAGFFVSANINLVVLRSFSVYIQFGTGLAPLLLQINLLITVVDIG